MANCHICRNQNNESECFDCVNRESLVDNFAQMSADEIVQVNSQRKSDELAQWVKTIEWESVKFSFVAGFWETFSKVSKFMAEEPGALHSVYCFEDSLIASNGRMGVVIPTGVPQELVGKSIIDLHEGNEASVLTEGWLDETKAGAAKAIFEPSGYINALNGTKEQLPLKYYNTWRSDKGNYALIEIADTVLLDLEHWHSLMELIGDEECFEVYYSSKEKCVLVKARTIMAVMYPGHIGSLFRG